MNSQKQILDSSISRRDFISNSGKMATGSALAGVALPMVHGKSSDVTKLALVGCGGKEPVRQVMHCRFQQQMGLLN